jgi:hypothetical protein
MSNLQKPSKLNESDTPVGDNLSVGETARERLMAAVQKTPEPGQYRRPSSALNSELPSSGGGAFNNLLQRMTGKKDRAGDLKHSLSNREETSSYIGDGKLVQKNSNRGISDVDRLEVPAFLRRQAN